MMTLPTVKKWKSVKNENVSLINNNFTKTIEGNYEFDPSTMNLKYTTNGIKGISKVSIVSCGSHSFMSQYKKFEEKKEIETTLSLSKLGITQIVGSINTEISKIKSKNKRRRIFVIPSQLNAAEYPSQHDGSLVKDVNMYKYDMTGGPRAQLAGDPAVAQFILDNASNTYNPDGINNIRSMNLQGKMELKNGYLIPTAIITDEYEYEYYSRHFEQQLQYMTILGIQDINVTGIVSDDYNEFSESSHKIDLIYGSAMPMSPEYGIVTNTLREKFLPIAKMVLMGQYVASMQWAIQRTNCELILMPLGGGVFQNELSTIKIAMAAAYSMMKENLIKSNVKVCVLAWEMNDDEITIFK